MNVYIFLMVVHVILDMVGLNKNRYYTGFKSSSAMLKSLILSIKTDRNQTLEDVLSGDMRFVRRRKF